MPRLLPPHLLSDLVDRRRIAVCLDYDGAIAPITPNPEEALPSAEIRRCIIALAERPARVLMAVASGRPVNQLRPLLGIDAPIALIGMHGLEVIDWQGHRRLTAPTTHCRKALDAARAWLNAIVASRRGFFLEDKGFALALHFRRVSPVDSGPTIARLETMVIRETPELELLHGDQVVELVPRVAPDKGFSFLSLIEKHSASRRTPVYFSNDPSDEGSFYKVRRYGVTVLVGPERQSCAEYRVNSREEMTLTLASIVEAIDR